ncbi:MAG: hypothetical protein DMG09_06200 [Acidobacteria bacterium]|nr:MAG: hypothetical protein DMG09_06200 [Acidobacteriota bacterium]
MAPSLRLLLDRQKACSYLRGCARSGRIQFKRKGFMKQPSCWRILLLFLAVGLAGTGSTAQREDKTKAREASCKMCHKPDGKGTMEDLDLTDNVWKHGNAPEDIEKVIREGVKGTGMRPIMGEHTDQEIKALVKYVLKFSETAPPAEPAKPAEPPAPPQPPPPVPPQP